MIYNKDAYSANKKLVETKIHVNVYDIVREKDQAELAELLTMIENDEDKDIITQDYLPNGKLNIINVYVVWSNSLYEPVGILDQEGEQ